MAYSSATYRSSNLIRRFAHNARFEFSARLVADHCSRDGAVLDYGAGDGHFLDVLAERGFSAVGYDPLPLIRRGDVFSSLPERSFDCITCLETLEHVSEDKLREFFADVDKLLKPGGILIISVPVMIGPVVLLKALPSVLRGDDKAHGYTWAGLLGALVGKPLERQQDPELGIYYHMGFDHRPLRMRLKERFALSEINSPFPWLPVIANSQVFFVGRRSNQ